MNAQDQPITQVLNGAKQFIVPIFQRDYSWGTKQCKQLWDDIIRVGSDENVKSHFLGSVVYVAAEETNAAITRWLLIDGQQRITTIILLLAALRDRMLELGLPAENVPSAEEVEDYYLINRHGKNDRRYKLHLRRADHDTVSALLDKKGIPSNPSEAVKENYNFLRNLVSNSEIKAVYAGIAKLVVVDVCLTRGQDDPQMIFESLNSTGLDLTQADLIRNFVLMRLDEALQTELYQDYWQPIEMSFGRRYRTEFDKFVKDFLTLQLRPSSPLRSSETYHDFQRYYSDNSQSRSINAILEDLRDFGGYYTAFSLGQEIHSKLKSAFARLRSLIEVAAPVVLALYKHYAQSKTLGSDEFIEAIELLESYVFRRSVCDMQTRSLGQIFASLAYRIKQDQPLLSLKIALARQGKKRRFPSDAEFQAALETRDIYNMRTCFYLLDRLENFDTKEPNVTDSYSIEHVMPQNDQLRSEWQEMLGSDWKKEQETWLHRLGNLTLTGYNATYSDKSFQLKKTIEHGFNESPVRLNRFMREQETWTATEIKTRGEQLAAKALEIWRPLVVDPFAIQQAELADHIAAAEKYSIDTIEMTAAAKALFDSLRPQIQALGSDISELPNSRSVIYRVFDFVVEVLPRSNRLGLLLNLEFSEADDTSDKAEDATQSAFIVNATEKGGVYFLLATADEIPSAMHLVRQAYELANE